MDLSIIYNSNMKPTGEIYFGFLEVKQIIKVQTNDAPKDSRYITITWRFHFCKSVRPQHGVLHYYVGSILI